MESQPQNPEFRINPENFHRCMQQSSRYCIFFQRIISTVSQKQEGEVALDCSPEFS